MKHFDKEHVERVFASCEREVELGAPDTIAAKALFRLETVIIDCCLEAPEEDCHKVIDALRKYLLDKIATMPRLSRLLKEAKNQKS